MSPFEKKIRSNPRVLAAALSELVYEGNGLSELGFGEEDFRRLMTDEGAKEIISDTGMINRIFMGASDEDAGAWLRATTSIYEPWQRRYVAASVEAWDADCVAKKPKRLVEWIEAGLFDSFSNWERLVRAIPEILKSEAVADEAAKERGIYPKNAEDLLLLDEAGVIGNAVRAESRHNEEFAETFMSAAMLSENQDLIEKTTREIFGVWRETNSLGNSYVMATLAEAGQWRLFSEACTEFDFRIENGGVWAPSDRNRPAFIDTGKGSDAFPAFKGEDLVRIWMSEDDSDVISEALRVSREKSPAAGLWELILAFGQTSVGSQEGKAIIEAATLRVSSPLPKEERSKPRI